MVKLPKLLLCLKNQFFSILIKFAYFSDGSSAERCAGISCRTDGMAPGGRHPSVSWRTAGMTPGGRHAPATRNEFPGKLIYLIIFYSRTDIQTDRHKRFGCLTWFSGWESNFPGRLHYKLDRQTQMV